LIAAAFIGASSVRALDGDEYVESVPFILRTHTQLMEAIAEMKQSCMNCRNHLPESAAPRVWDIPRSE
jgi:hypothetical protein